MARNAVAKTGGGGGSEKAAAGPVRLRLHHALAEVGVASRRACEQLMMDGKVFVNGRRVDRLPAFVDPAVDRVVVSGREVSLRPLVREGARGEVGPRRWYVMVNKPERYLTSTADVEGEIRGSERKTVLDLVTMPGMGRLVPVGRLEFHASGLVLLTNDGELINRLTHARYGVSKTYRVWVRGGVDEASVRSLSEKVDKMCVRMAKRAGAPLRAGASIATVELAGAGKPEVKTNANMNMNAKRNGDGSDEVRGGRRGGGERGERGARGVSGRALDAAAARRAARENEERAEAFEAVAEDDEAIAARGVSGGAAGGPGVGEVDARTGKRLGGAKTAIDVTLRGAAGKLKLPAMLTYLGLRIDKIMQVAIGDVELRDVAVGQWRPLTVQEIKSLKRSSRAPEGAVALAVRPGARGDVQAQRQRSEDGSGAREGRGMLSAQQRGIERERARQGALAERAAVEMASGWGDEVSALDVDINAGGEGRFVDERARMSARGRAEAKAREERRSVGGAGGDEAGGADGDDSESHEHRPEEQVGGTRRGASRREGVPKAKAEITRGPLIKRFGSARRGGAGGGGEEAGA